MNKAEDIGCIQIAELKQAFDEFDKVIFEQTIAHLWKIPWIL